MKKIPTLFERLFVNHRVVDILRNVTPGMEWVLRGDGIATEKLDGSCCAIINGLLYKRYDAKKGKTPPEDAIPCCDPDPITGHWPHWVAVDPMAKSDRWYWEAFVNTFEDLGDRPEDGTYEAIGPHFNANPHKLNEDILARHDEIVLEDGELGRSFEGIKKYLEENEIEGIVFWKDGEPRCKIKRTDFGLPWPVKE